MAYNIDDIKKEQNRFSDELTSCKGMDFNIENFVNVEVIDLPPISLDEADLSCASDVSTPSITTSCPKCVMLEKEVMRLKDENILLKENTSAIAPESQRNTDLLQKKIEALEYQVELLETLNSVDVNIDIREKVQGSLFNSLLVSSPHERPLIKDDPDTPSTSQDCSEFILGIGSDFNIKEEDIKEEVYYPPFCFDEAASSSGSVNPAHFRMNSNIGAENAEEQSVKYNEVKVVLRKLTQKDINRLTKSLPTYEYRKQPNKLDIRNTKGAERGSLPPDDIYSDPSSNLMSSESKESIQDTSVKKTNLDDSTKKQMFPCSLCNKWFSSKYTRNYHSQVHSEEFSYICQYCGKRFLFRGDRDRHVRTHTGEQRFRCGECGRKFSFESGLNKHFLTHTGEKPYQCLICMKRYSNSSTLVHHNNYVHLKIKSFKCPLCDKRFSLKSGLERHESMHTGEKRFECEICFRKYLHFCDFKSHQLTHK